MAIYGERVALLPQLLQILHYHPEGMRFTDLAHEVGRSEADVRETLRVYHLTDLAHYLPNLVVRPDVLEFMADDPKDDADPTTATKVRLGDVEAGAELGVAHVRLQDLARLYRVAHDALSLYPDDPVLASAVGKLADGVLPGFRIIEPEPWAHLDELWAAIHDHRRIIDHVRPRLVPGDRGAGDRAAPADQDPAWLGAGRHPGRCPQLVAYLSAGQHPFPGGVLGDFRGATRPDRHDHQAPEVLTVIMDVPPHARWAVDKYAEQVELIDERAELTRLKVRVLQPYRLRVGLMLVAGGPTASVVAPEDLRDAGAEVAQMILRSYESNSV